MIDCMTHFVEKTCCGTQAAAPPALTNIIVKNKSVASQTLDETNADV